MGECARSAVVGESCPPHGQHSAMPSTRGIGAVGLRKPKWNVDRRKVGGSGRAGHGSWKRREHPLKGRYKAICLALKSSLIAPEGVIVSGGTKGIASALARTAKID